MRIELKPEDAMQERDFNLIIDLILAEAGTQNSEKWGTPIFLEGGRKIWLNRDTENNYWIETDDLDELVLPEDIKIIGVNKSSIKTG